MVERIKTFFREFISGRLGLATTFWLCGVLIAVTLNYLTSSATMLWQIVPLAFVAFIHFVLIVIAVWNASKLFTGWRLWKWLARIVVSLNVVKWLWYLPVLIPTISSALGFPIYSNNYWELDARQFVCRKAEFLHTPERLARKYKCATSVNSNIDLIALRCMDNGNMTDYIFAMSETSCQKNLAKIQHLRK
jgi:hypothetical protein